MRELGEYVSLPVASLTWTTCTVVIAPAAADEVLVAEPEVEEEAGPRGVWA